MAASESSHPRSSEAWPAGAAPALVRSDRRRRRLRPAALEAAALLAVTIAGAGVLLDAAWKPSPEATRNPAFRRNWPAWVAAAEPRHPGETLVVLLGNSQAYGREVGAREIYAARLVPLLRERTRRPVRVVNWAVPGGSALEYVLAAAAAHRLQPTVVLLVTGPGSFGRWLWATESALGRTVSDLRLLLADPAVRRRLPAAYRARWVHTGDLLDAWLARAVPLWRYRDLPRSLLLSIAPVMGAFEKDGGQDRWLFDRGETRIESWPPRPTSPELQDVVLEAIGTLAADRLVVRMPVHSVVQDHHPRWMHDLTARAAPRGIATLDLHTAVPDDAFRTASHLDARGHARLAALLADALAPLVP